LFIVAFTHIAFIPVLEAIQVASSKSQKDGVKTEGARPLPIESQAFLKSMNT
jgi:hypothetical protein